MQQHLRRGELAPALGCLQQLRSQPISAPQRALLLHLQALAERQRGDRELAWQLGCQSLEQAYNPAQALTYLELVLLPAVRWPLLDQWIPLMQNIVRAGLGPQLLRQLAHILQTFPLDQQRQQLLRAIEEQNGLLLHEESSLLRGLWQRLQRMAYTM